MNNIQQSQNSSSEVEAVYKIVLRNLQPDNYAQLMLDARPAILNEATTLLSCSELSTSKKQLLLESLKSLRLKNFQMSFKFAHELPQKEKNHSSFFKDSCIHGITTMGDSENRDIGGYQSTQRS